MTSPFSGLAGGSDYSNNSNGRSSSKKKKEKGIETKEIFVRKYSSGIPLAEQIKIGGRSMFLQIIDGLPVLSGAIDLSQEKGIILKPHQSIGSIPPVLEYEYNDRKEIEYFIEVANRMHVDDFYFLVKSIFKDVVATKEKELIVLLATDTVMSFFQDLFVTTHYLLLTGPPGWGKGAILVAFKLLGYRVILAGDMSGANLLDLLGSTERCQVSIAEDELDNIEDDPDKQRIYKMGYEDIGLVTRTVDPSSSNRDIKFYNPYCIKIFGSEKGSDSKELGGFNDRIFRSEVKKGKPKLLIKQIKKQMERPPDKQLPKYRKVVSRINFLRKLSLIFRLIHHDDTIEEVPLNIDSRPLELCGPAISVFNSDTLADPNRKALPEIMDALTYFLKRKGELDRKTIEVEIYGVLKDLFEQMDIEERAPGTSTIFDQDACKKEVHDDIYGDKATTYVVSYDEICSRVMKEVDGNFVSQRTFESPDYPRVTHDSLLEKCRRIFGGEYASLGSKKDKKKALRFDKDAVNKAGETFSVVSKIEIVKNQREDDTPDDSEDRRMWDEWTGGTNGNNNSSHSGDGGDGGDDSSSKGGTKILTQNPKKEGFDTDDRKQNTLKSLVRGTKGLRFIPQGQNDELNDVSQDTTLEDLHSKDVEVKNITKIEESLNDNYNFDSDTEKPSISSNEPKLVPKSPQQQQKQGQESWPLGTPEQAKVFRDACERLGKEHRE